MTTDENKRCTCCTTAREEITALRAALDFYADPETYKPFAPSGDGPFCALDWDCSETALGWRPGNAARIALSDQIPSSEISRAAVAAGIDLVALLFAIGLQPSLGAARRLLVQGGVYINEQRVDPSGGRPPGLEAVVDGAILIRVGKKTRHLLRVVG